MAVERFHAVMILLICSTAAMKDPRSQFYRHAIVQPYIYTDTKEKRDLHSIKVRNEEKLTIGFVAFERNFIVDLKMNVNLLPSHYFEKYHRNGTHVTHLPFKKDKRHCHYQGFLRGIKSSWAAMSTCNGLSGVIYDGSELHYIHPDQKSVENNHFLFKASEFKNENFTCGYRKNEKLPRKVIEELKRNRRSTDPYKSNSQSRFVELVIVNDNKEFKELKEDKDLVFERSKEIANIVNGLYSPLNIFIALVGVIVWSEHDEIKLSPDGDTTLTNFLHYRRERLALEHPNDNAQLITAMTLDNGVVGKGLKGPICTYAFSGGISVDHSHVVGLVANTVAHELGHNLGFEHDSEECQCPDEKCIMAPSSSSSSPKHWSSCSKEYLEMSYLQGMDYCLHNRPATVIGGCGNGFVEEGEECDCGLTQFCDSKCCNASSCMLAEDATCAVGSCCDTSTCQVKKAATVCREAISECDLSEYCDGVSEFCPGQDIFRQNGEECGNGKAYCFDGQCQSHADQCRLLWGPTGRMSDSRCFEQNNVKGNESGNCGFNRLNQTYQACAKEDVLCGLLFCTHLNEKLEFGMESAAILARSFISVKGEIFPCRSALVDLGLSTIDPGLTPNGAKCGDGKACFNQKCVPLSILRGSECQCNGNGVCNSKGNCHCDVGYAPPFCESFGPGGSIDSGPASDDSSRNVAMYVVFLGLVAAALAAAVYYYRSHLKTWWSKKVHKANIKSRTSTTTQRKAQPPSKFRFDRHSLRTLEISGPIPIINEALLQQNVVRPKCPPPRPPPPTNTYEEVSTPNSSYYDDCQTLDNNNCKWNSRRPPFKSRPLS